MTPSRVTRPMTRRRAARLLAALAALALFLAPTPALADCMQPPPIEEAVKSAEVLFVGTVTATSNRNAWADVSIEEIWRGPDQPATVLIRGGPGGNSATSVDRSFEPGVRYLFFPILDQQKGLTDNSCTSTTPWAEPMTALRPAEVRTPTGAAAGGGFDFTGVLAPIVVAVVAAGALAAVGLLVRGRQDS